MEYTAILWTSVSVHEMIIFKKKLKNPIRDFLGKADWNLLVEK